MTVQILRGYRECAEVLGVSPATLANRSSKGTLPFEPIDLVGNTLIYDRAEVVAQKHHFKPMYTRRRQAKAARKSRT